MMKLSLIASLGKSMEYHETAHISTDSLLGCDLPDLDSICVEAQSMVSSYLLKIQLPTSFTQTSPLNPDDDEDIPSLPPAHQMNHPASMHLVSSHSPTIHPPVYSI